MAGVNKVILLGNLGADPEVRALPSGVKVANINIATSESYTGKDGQRVDQTEWHNIVMYRKLAEIAGEYVKKGRPIYVEGRLKYGKYTDQSGVEKNTVDIIATEMQLLGGREGGGAPSGGGDDGGYDNTPRRPAAAAQRPAAAPARPAPAGKPAASSGFDDMDDDIPF
jgi:single-strand DNA-binding protein